MFRKGQTVWGKSGREYSVLSLLKDCKEEKLVVLESKHDDCPTTMVRESLFDNYYSTVEVKTITVRFFTGQVHSYFVSGDTSFLEEGDVLYSVEHKAPVKFIREGGAVKPNSPQEPIKFLRFGGEI